MGAFSELFRSLRLSPGTCAMSLHKGLGMTRRMLDTWNNRAPDSLNWLTSYECHLRLMAEMVEKRRRCLQSHFGTSAPRRGERHTLEQLIGRVRDARAYADEYALLILRLRTIEPRVNVAAQMASARADAMALPHIRRLVHPVPFEGVSYWRCLTLLDESTSSLRSHLRQLSGCDLARVYAPPEPDHHGNGHGR